MEAGLQDVEREAIAEERRLLERALDRILPSIQVSRSCPQEVVHCSDHSNPLLEVRLGSRRLMVKRGLEPWSAAAFRAGSRAAGKIAEHTDILVPRYLDLPEEVDGSPVLAWWRLEQPTLGDAWPTLDARQRDRALTSCGRLLRRLHEVPAERWGPLVAPENAARGDGGDVGTGIAGFLQRELAGRLRPAAQGVWREGVRLVDALRERTPDVRDRVGKPRLVHNDPHICNILCEVEDDDVRCVGMLDLEAAAGGPPEADLSYMRLVHSPEMAGRLGDGWLERVLDGYDRRLDSELMRFFRVFHILNIGIFAALKGSTGEASHLAGLGRETLERH